MHKLTPERILYNKAFRCFCVIAGGETDMGKDLQNKKESISMPHGLTLQDRSRMSLSGIKDVVNFDDSQVILNTDLGTLTIRGEQIHVDQLNLDTGDLSLTGRIEALEYDDILRHGSFLGRLLR